MEYLVIAFVPCAIINMLYVIKRDKIYMWALKFLIILLCENSETAAKSNQDR